MNLFQGANASATFLILSAVVAGIAQGISKVQEDPFTYLLSNPSMLYLAGFIVVFRIKTLLDDHKHFGEPHQGTNTFRYIGFILAVLSWLFWAIAAYLIPTTVRSSELMATSIGISTLWIAVHVIEILVDRQRRNTEVLTSVMREKWVLVNIAYMLCLFAHIGFFAPLIAPGAPTPLLLLLGILLFDILTSRSFRDIIKT
jgi:hypothetical protein